jgi:ribonuclease T1
MTKGLRTTIGAIAGLIAIVGVVVMVTRTSDQVATRASTTATTSSSSRARSSTTTSSTTRASTTTSTTRLADGTIVYSDLPTIAFARLPKEAKKTLAVAGTEGPFHHAQDGSVFENRERLLPRREPGHYREYTVDTPGSSDRGARRIVIGASGERYYSDDHYASFREIVGR